VLSNINQRYNDNKKLAKEINKATYLLLWYLLLLDFTKNIKKAPIVGNKISEESIGIFII